MQFDQKWPNNCLFYIFAPFIPCDVVTLDVTTTYGTYHYVNGVKQKSAGESSLTNTLTFIIVAMTTVKLGTANKTAGKKKVNMHVR